MAAVPSQRPEGAGAVKPRAAAPAPRSTSSVSPRSPMTSTGVTQGAGVLLGFLVWGWVVLPFLTGGPSKVKSVLMAKFLNKAADGTPLP